MMSTKKLLLILAVALMIAALPVFSQTKVTITVYGDEGQNLTPVEWMKPLAAARGITIDIVGVPFTSVYEKLKTEFVGGTGAYDMVVFYPPTSASSPSSATSSPWIPCSPCMIQRWTT